MKPGGGSHKGSRFERKLCKLLALWVSNNKNEDCLWRTAGSGSRATTHMKRGKALKQVGDLCAMGPEAEKFCAIWFSELKHRKDLRVTSFLFSDTGLLAGFWEKTVQQARAHGRDPMLIARENNGPIFIVTLPDQLAHIVPPVLSRRMPLRGADITLLDDLLCRPCPY